MTIIKCTPAETPVLHAVLWTGENSLDALRQLPGFDPFVADGFWGVYDNELYIRYVNEPDQIAKPNQHYVLRGTTGYFFVVPKEEFERTYVLLEDGEPRWTHQHVANVLGNGKRSVTYEEAYILATRIVGHYEGWIGAMNHVTP